ncbi:signal peptidase complex subunit-like protein [Hapsidospora chrysogenum ATCC 11550]|uniref:Signal peptidase complex subunit 1 n=1 Tax=Hapsidospora chrysogenum (strain ATCC 11550 / CBS 779.69 / DSM 880 / IAM 14645 / JCM 23072 / IMI 49137) TaxID=857340 RepID=A0A086T174_HAPC1|nr:signal peptidase complex subunit-like protein [Hapsidospora chrysogenum ATCC 11550]
MAEEILDKVRDVVDGEIDFDGQRRSEVIATLLLAVSGLLSFNIGYAKQDIVLAVYIGLAGTLLTFLIAVPPWPFFKRNPVKWLPAGSGMTRT